MPDNSVQVYQPEVQVVSAREQEMQRFMPVMSMQVATERRQTIVEAVKRLMEDGQDFGIIPGTTKPTLLQPGSDKLCNLFGLVPTFLTTEKELDWTGERHAGEPFIFYSVKCRLMRGDYMMGEGEGSCNSWESKYRYRKSERVCPTCGGNSVIKGKAEYGGGWLCFKKQGGCGAKFKDGDQSIEGQETGRKPNPEIFDMVNTILKMANKRAKIAATLNATSAHEFFTQDMEDIQPAAAEPMQANGAAAEPIPTESAKSPELAKAVPVPTGKDFGKLRKDFLEFGTGGAAEYDRVMGKHCEQGKTFPATVRKAQAAYAELQESLKTLAGFMQAGTEPFKAGEDDLSPELQGSGEAA